MRRASLPGAQCHRFRWVWRMTAILRALQLGVLGPNAFGQLTAPALERRTSSDNDQQDVRGFDVGGMFETSRVADGVDE